MVLQEEYFNQMIPDEGHYKLINPFKLHVKHQDWVAQTSIKPKV